MSRMHTIENEAHTQVAKKNPDQHGGQVGL
jgi:hypothetical protein